MDRVSAFGRDKPHSPPQEATRGSAPWGRGAVPQRAATGPAANHGTSTAGAGGAIPRPANAAEPDRGEVSAAGPVGVGLVLAATIAAASPLPAGGWTEAEHPLVLPTAGPLGWLWDALVLALPVGERGARYGFGTLLVALAVAAAAGLLAFRLYRGVGRAPAAATTVPLCAVLLLAWLREGPTDAPATLGVGLLATLALATLVDARVRGQAADRATWARGGVAAILALGTWCFGHVPLDSPITIDVGAFTALARAVGPTVLYLALALLLLLLLPLRWRGGGPLLVVAGAALVLVDRSGPLAPEPLRLVLIAVAACGWIWLAGSIAGRESGAGRRWLARAAAGFAVAILMTLAGARVKLASEPAAARRPTASLLALQQRGLIAPGDVLLAHDPWLAAAFAAAQRDEGLRPDVELHAAAELDASRLSDRLAAWARADRRVLSDSFSYAGRWQAAWTLDSGPLFWFIGTASVGDRDFTDLRAYAPALDDPTLTASERARWERLQVERTRHRRALGLHDEAVLALPLADDELAALAQRLHLARLSRLPAVAGSELGPAPWPAAPPPASALAEAGDLLLALGDGAAGTTRLDEAAARGVAEAFAALARWQLRAGEEEAARATLAVVAATPGLRPQLLGVCRWLVARARVEQAAALLAAAAPAPAFAAEELGLRLAVLRELAGP